MEASNSEFVEAPFHNSVQKVEGELIGWLFKPMTFDKKVLSLMEKVNKNYRLPLERLYERGILRKLDYRKKLMAVGSVCGIKSLLIAVCLRSNLETHGAD